MLQKMGGVKRSRDFRVSVWNDRLFQGLGQEAAFRAVVMMPVAVVPMVMMTFPVVCVMMPCLFLPKKHNRHRHLVVMVVGHRRMSQQYYIGYQQHHYEERSLHDEKNFGAKILFFAHYRQNLSRCQQRGDNSRLRKKRYESIFSPTMEMMSVVMKNSRQKVAGSWKTKMPNRTVPTAPMPVHTG